MAVITSVLVGLLTNLGEVCRARALALWVPLDGRLDLLADWQLDQRLYDLLRDLDPSRAELSIGSRFTVGADVHVLPVLGSDGALMAILQFVGDLPERNTRRRFLDDGLRELAAVLREAAPDGSEAAGLLTLVLGEASQESNEIEQRTYEAVLERCGWDVSVVATVLEMTRQALYEELDALSIARPTP